jgi:hypothetical protein
LQLDLFVTNFDPGVPLGYNDIESPTFPDTLDPTSSKVPPEGQGVSLDEDDEFVDDQIPDDDFVDLSYYTGEYNETGEFGHEEHRLDLTNFDGENDDRLPGETTLNHTLKKEGTIRRALTRKTRVHHRKGKSSLEERPVSGSGAPHALPLGDWDASGPRDRFTDGSLDWERKTVSSAFSHASSQQPLVRKASKGVELELGGQEMRDVNVMTEFALPGRPKIDSILKDEAGRTSGRVVVACEWLALFTTRRWDSIWVLGCGPATLNAVVRKAVAAQINPSRIRQGDYGGSIDLVVEDFSY